MNRYFDRVAYGERLVTESSPAYTTDDIYLMASYLLYEKRLSYDEAFETIRNKIILTTIRDRDKEIQSQIDRAFESKASDISSIDFYKGELDIIASLEDNKKQRVLFTMLGIAKYHNALNYKNDDWVSKPQNFIFSSAGVHASIVEQCKIIYELKENGMILNTRKADNNRVKILFCQHEPARPVLSCRDLEGLGAIYQNHIGGIYMRGKVLKRCPICDIPFLDASTHNNRVYCSKCRNKYIVKREELRCYV